VKIKINGVEANITSEAFTFEGGRFETIDEADAMAHQLRWWIRRRRVAEERKAESDRLSGLMGGFREFWEDYMAGPGGDPDDDPPPDLPN